MCDLMSRHRWQLASNPDAKTCQQRIMPTFISLGWLFSDKQTFSDQLINGNDTRWRQQPRSLPNLFETVTAMGWRAYKSFGWYEHFQFLRALQDFHRLSARQPSPFDSKHPFFHLFKGLGREALLPNTMTDPDANTSSGGSGILELKYDEVVQVLRVEHEGYQHQADWPVR